MEYRRSNSGNSDEALLKALKTHEGIIKGKGVQMLNNLVSRRLHNDRRVVRRFRIWQIKQLSQNISRFKRQVRQTNRKYLICTIKVLNSYLKKVKRFYFKKFAGQTCKVPVPTSVSEPLALCKLLSYTNMKQAKTSATWEFKLFKLFNQHGVKDWAFKTWKAEAYMPNPFLNRNKVLTLQTLSIVLKRNWRLQFQAWKKIQAAPYKFEVIPIVKLLELKYQKLLKLALRKISQPRFPVRRRWDDPEIVENYKRRALATGSTLLEALARKKLGYDYAEVLNLLSVYFVNWKKVTTRNLAIPEFIRTRQSRQWSISLLNSTFRAISYRNKLQSFSKLKLYFPFKQGGNFEIDKAIISNQCCILEKLEKQLNFKAKETMNNKKLEKLDSISYIFTFKFSKIFQRWSRSKAQEVNYNKQELFEYLNYLESQAHKFTQHGQNLRALIERRSHEPTLDNLSDSFKIE